MEDLLSPRQVAQALGVSESSLKRWCDRGLLSMRRTAGGHRRLPLDSVLDFLRRSGQPLLRPEVLGLPSTTGKGSLVIDRAIEQLTSALQEGDEETCRRTIFDLYLSGQSALDICDKVVSTTFHAIGDRWECNQLEVYQERRGCEICLRVLYELRMAIKQPPTTARLAIGGTLSDDLYQIPTTMAEIALREAGWQAHSLGTNLPVDTLCAAVEEEQPQLLWISSSFIQDEASYLADFEKLFSAAQRAQVPLVVGGRALTPALRQQMNYSAYCDTMRHLVTFAANISLEPKHEATSQS